MKPTAKGEIVIGDEQEPSQLRVTLSILTDREEQFIDALDKLCREYATDREYLFKFE